MQQDLVAAQLLELNIHGLTIDTNCKRAKAPRSKVPYLVSLILFTVFECMVVGASIRIIYEYYHKSYYNVEGVSIIDQRVWQKNNDKNIPFYFSILSLSCGVLSVLSIPLGMYIIYLRNGLKKKLLIASFLMIIFASMPLQTISYLVPMITVPLFGFTAAFYPIMLVTSLVMSAVISSVYSLVLREAMNNTANQKIEIIYSDSTHSEISPV
ncbi:K(+)/H(+) antiporter NhaP [Acrasis kona]|uniref:K(+)/H(+) antiporter NhaP n=1 Tax=Acrasis kona TaxID=1008807 RepID=A0AAW2YXC1_9EUKA